MNLRTTSALLTVAGLAAAASATPISITVENTQSEGGFFFTPFWVGVHDGSFDSYDGGTPAANWPGLTEIAELGNTAPLSAQFDAVAPGGTQDTLASVAFDGDAPVFSPGESATFSLDVADPTNNRYFSYASMLIPSNDLFVANGNPTAHQLFNADGSFSGPLTIEIYGRDLNDNGTELNSASNDAAFSANGGSRISEDGLIRNFFTESGDIAYIQSFIGSQTANGATITQGFDSGTLLARITVVPAPSAAALLAFAAPATLRRRRH